MKFGSRNEMGKKDPNVCGNMKRTRNSHFTSTLFVAAIDSQNCSIDRTLLDVCEI